MAAVDYAKTLSNVTVRLCDAYNFVPPHQADASASAAAAAEAAARSDAPSGGADALREEVGDVGRAIGTMVEDFRSSEAEARARGEYQEGGVSPLGGGLATAEGRDAAAEEVLRQARERGEQGNDGIVAGGVGRVLGEGRRGPTVEEILRPGRAGAGRTAASPPPTAAAREAAAGAVAVTLPWMLRKGILSRCKASQGMAMRTLQRLVKVCDREALMPHLAELVATLIEGLSALEPQVRPERSSEIRLRKVAGVGIFCCVNFCDVNGSEQPVDRYFSLSNFPITPARTKNPKTSAGSSVYAVPRRDPAGDDTGPNGEAAAVRVPSRTPPGRSRPVLSPPG